MLSDDEIRAVIAPLFGTRDALEFAMSTSIDEYRAIIAAHTAKLLAGVEMPEYKYIDRHDVPKEGMCVYTQDQRQQYAAACAAQAREKALDEAKMEAVKRHNAGEAAGILISAAIESLKGKQV